MKLSRIIKISRPRFWLYLFASYFAIGGVAAAWKILQSDSINGLVNSQNFFQVLNNLSPQNNPLFWLFALYFTIPANLLLYGINDIYDYETDKNNPKKIEYEALVEPKEWNPLFKIIAVLNLPFIIASFFLSDLGFIAFWAYFISAFLYSMPPIRAKARPILDSMMSAINYITAGVLGFVVAGGGMSDLKYVLAGFLWCMAMHAFSAVPDIKADEDVKVYTIATLLRRKNTLLFCLVLYVISAILIFNSLPIVAVLGGLIYAGIMLISLTKTDKQLFKIYKIFPLLNALTGAGVFFEILFNILR